MKHNNIAATLGWTAVEDINEGLFLQPEEAASIDAALSTVVTAGETAAALETANGTIATHEATIATMQTAATTNATTIADLQGQIATLSKKPSGAGSTLKVAAATEVVEEKISTTGKPAFNSEEHPANKFADAQKKYDSGLPAKK